MDNFCLTPTVYKNHNPVPTASFSVPDPPPPRFPPLPPPPTAQTSFLPNSQLDGPIFLTYPTPSGTVSTRDDSARQGDSPVTAPPPKRQPSQRAFGRSSKKRKTGKADINDKITLLQCCMTVKPESLARHLKSDGHKRNAGLPLDRPEVCSFCNIAFARQDARNRHFRSQHGGGTPPPVGTVYAKLKKPSATHPSLLPKRRK
ncbi:hypothetical protein DFH94DRAFT_750427 [Russula ochroleuca]|uniref:C2H2-type domain-containing protein n=1 Tax=Russula ochroleuca TaxID=152965 RepID=A0A9P5MTT2_9AGAM|nr:hypothetical protein DFH94DRAFT_750427 [Russula ochroleuca]